MKPICIGCHKTPKELPEYHQEFTGAPIDDPVAYVKEEEGTYNPNNGHFLCTECYIKAGMPTSPHGWVAP